MCWLQSGPSDNSFHRENQASEMERFLCTWQVASEDLEYETWLATLAIAAKTALPVASLAVTSGTAADNHWRKAGK
jgi:hypothetical protein